MLVVFGSVKGSPGVSCLTAGVAACWLRREAGHSSDDGPGRSDRGGARSAVRPVVLVEADPAGGVLATRAGLPPLPGLAGLAAQARGAALSAGGVARHAQVLPSGAAVLVGPVGGDQASSVLDVLAEAVARFARSRPDMETLLVDAGRLDIDTAAWPLVDGADGLVLVVRADAEGLGQAASWLGARPELAGRVALVLRAPSAGPEFPPREVVDELGLAVLARLPTDPVSAGRAVAGPSGRGAARSAWWRAVGQVTEQVCRLRPLVFNDPVTATGPGSGLRRSR